MATLIILIIVCTFLKDREPPIAIQITVRSCASKIVSITHTETHSSVRFHTYTRNSSEKIYTTPMIQYCHEMWNKRFVLIQTRVYMLSDWLPSKCIAIRNVLTEKHLIFCVSSFVSPSTYPSLLRFQITSLLPLPCYIAHAVQLWNNKNLYL